ncbi:hypothetical protein IU469_33675, partial [Nocardia puris]|uniref:hypothetical protein n=1 Tax=Nocardia puris TaxID=208602 RepID=UPI001896166B
MKIRQLTAEGRRLYARLYAAVLDSGERRVVLSSEGDTAPTTDLLVWAGNNLPVLLDALDEAEEARARAAELEAHQPPLLLLGKEFEARAAIDRVRKLHQPENRCDNPVHTVPDATCPQC